MGRTIDPTAAAAPGSAAQDLAAALAAARLDWIVPGWPAPANVGAVSTTRNGGVSMGTAASMNVGLTGALREGIDTIAAVDANRDRLASFLPSPPVWLAQVHGTAVVTLDAHCAAAARASPPRADAAVTRERAIVCAVQTADCMPVLFADRRGAAVGVAHAGWRGLAAGVLDATIAALAALGAPRDDLTVWLGPAIGPGAFEVGPDVREAYAAVDPGSAECFVPHGPGKWLADLCRLARRRLAAAGIHDVHGGDFCTLTEAARFHSYRRDRVAGRMATVIWLAPDRAAATI